MNKYLFGFIFLLCGCSVHDSEIDKIIKAKTMVKALSNYPDTVQFHEMSTRVNGDIVTLKFTCQNGFGVPQTLTLDIAVKDE